MVVPRRYQLPIAVANAAAYLFWTGWIVGAVVRKLHREVWRRD